MRWVHVYLQFLVEKVIKILRQSYLESEHSALSMVCRAFCVLFCSVLYFSHSDVGSKAIVVLVFDVIISGVVVVVTNFVVGSCVKSRLR